MGKAYTVKVVSKRASHGSQVQWPHVCLEELGGGNEGGARRIVAVPAAKPQRGKASRTINAGRQLPDVFAMLAVGVKR